MPRDFLRCVIASPGVSAATALAIFALVVVTASPEVTTSPGALVVPRFGVAFVVLVAETATRGVSGNI